MTSLVPAAQRQAPDQTEATFGFSILPHRQTQRESGLRGKPQMPEDGPPRAPNNAN